MKNLYDNAREAMRRDAKKYWYDGDGNEYELPMKQIHNTKAFEILEEQYPDVNPDEVHPSEFLLSNNWIRAWINKYIAEIDVNEINKKVKDTIVEIIKKHKVQRISFENKSNPKQDGFYDTEEFLREIL